MSDACESTTCPHGCSIDQHCLQCPDPCVVDAAPLASVIESFVRDWRRTRPSLKGRYADPDEDVEPVAPYTFLAVDTGLARMHARRAGRDEPTDADVTLAERDLKRVRSSERNPVVELRVADAIVSSIGEPGMFFGDDPLLRIRPNPKAPRYRHGECCGGSTVTGTGSPDGF